MLEKTGIRGYLLPALKEITKRQEKTISVQLSFSTMLLIVLFLASLLYGVEPNLYVVVTTLWGCGTLLPIAHKIHKNNRAVYICDEVEAGRVLISDEDILLDSMQQIVLAQKDETLVTVFITKNNKPIPICTYSRKGK